MKNILLIATGGTIASKDNGNGLTPSIDVNVLLDYIPVIRQKCHVTGISLMNIDSSNMDTSHISSISECIMNNYTWNRYMCLHCSCFILSAYKSFKACHSYRFTVTH